ncbi:amino acid transporter [Pseudomonas sp. TH08]|uniref:nucleotidyltransferase domain-containing protein n=1 Tax=unclassified Pseudomonas TaxID=196821 RepID=UPI0019143134|nr:MULTISPECIES: amino acid transporter [unclassified Pseudomonas]MBK5529348.1 amino acid transporter [Pseudomonas sp. TH06]MBK5534457.1 amino acid transporter [Pseudomonas sp. TH08]
MKVPDQQAWQPWTPDELAQRLKQISRPWSVVGGWALDLWLGRQTRDHGDLEFTVLRDDFLLFRQALSPLQFYTVRDGTFEFLSAERMPGEEIFQVWGFDVVANVWRVDVMLESGTSDIWVYKRDTSLVYPRAEMVVLSATGIPYLKPAAILLFKAKHTRPKDQADFSLALPNLPCEDRHWLARHLAQLHPDHEWTNRLENAE